jgi:DNA-binding Lrp family transcriptional regulator
VSDKHEKHEANMRTVARYVHENPAASQGTIASDTGLSFNQVKHCLDDLKNKGHIRYDYWVDPEYLGYPIRFRVDIFVSPSKLRDGKGGLPEDQGVGSQKELAMYILRRLPNKDQFRGKILVDDVQILLGHPADLSAAVRASTNKDMLDFVTGGLRMCNAVYQTASCLESWSCKNGEA